MRAARACSYVSAEARVMAEALFELRALTAERPGARTCRRRACARRATGARVCVCACVCVCVWPVHADPVHMSTVLLGRSRLARELRGMFEVLTSAPRRRAEINGWRTLSLTLRPEDERFSRPLRPHMVRVSAYSPRHPPPHTHHHASRTSRMWVVSHGSRRSIARFAIVQGLLLLHPASELEVELGAGSSSQASVLARLPSYVACTAPCWSGSSNRALLCRRPNEVAG